MSNDFLSGYLRGAVDIGVLLACYGGFGAARVTFTKIRPYFLANYIDQSTIKKTATIFAVIIITILAGTAFGSISCCFVMIPLIICHSITSDVMKIFTVVGVIFGAIAGAAAALLETTYFLQPF